MRKIRIRDVKKFAPGFGGRTWIRTYFCLSLYMKSPCSDSALTQLPRLHFLKEETVANRCHEIQERVRLGASRSEFQSRYSHLQAVG